MFKKKKNEKFSLSSIGKTPKIVAVTLVAGILFGMVLNMSGGQISNTTIFDYLKFLLLVCILALVLDNRRLLKN
jgi:hypothetical protein